MAEKLQTKVESKISNSLKAKVTRRAKKENISVSQLIRNLLQAFVK